MTDNNELPALPDAADVIRFDEGWQDVFTNSQMHAYARAALAQRQGEPSDDDMNRVTLDKRDLFHTVRGAIKGAIETDESDRAADWSRAHDLTVHCLSPLIAAPATAEQPAEPKGLTDDQWYDLASRHSVKDWDGDGYLNAVKSLCNDFAATAPAPVAPQATPASDELERQRIAMGQERTPAYGDALALCRRLEANAPAAPVAEALTDALDAQRYRWLRVQPNNTNTPRIDVVRWTAADESANDGEGLRLADLDAAIDAAIASTKKDSTS